MRNHRHGSVVDGHADLHSELGPNRGEHSGRATNPTIKSVCGKVVVITGGARGIGLATASALHQLGAKVAIGDIDEPAVKQVGANLGLDVYGRLDVTDHDSFAGFLDEVESRLGPIDVLVNNAGILPVGRLVDEPDALTRRALAVNVYGVIVGTKVAARRMLARRSGHIINVASVNSETPSPGVATYCATKHAVLGFTNSVRAEHRGTGVHYSAVLPAMTDTEMVAGIDQARGLTNAEPTDVASAIVGLIRKPKRRVTITRAAGAVLVIQRILPGSVADALRRSIGLDHLFTDRVDVGKRATYEQRVHGT
jgi:NAD(P)-dependent dehydrogenase (short-subunit alcohol dehydrogenase family)